MKGFPREEKKKTPRFAYPKNGPSSMAKKKATVIQAV